MGVFGVLRKGLGVLGDVAKAGAPLVGFIPGVGTLAGAGLGALGSVASDVGHSRSVNLGGALRSGALGAAGGLVGGALRGAKAAGGIGSVVSRILSSGNASSLIPALASAVPGVASIPGTLRAQGRANELLAAEAELARRRAELAQQAIQQTAPLREAALARLSARLQSPPDYSAFTDTLNPFARRFAGAGQPAPAAGPPPGEQGEAVLPFTRLAQALGNSSGAPLRRRALR